MLGPEVSWYLIVAAMLFAIGALGVLIRRSPLIVLLSLEIMLNGANRSRATTGRRMARSSPSPSWRSPLPRSSSVSGSSSRSRGAASTSTSTG